MWVGYRGRQGIVQEPIWAVNTPWPEMVGRKGRDYGIWRVLFIKPSWEGNYLQRRVIASPRQTYQEVARGLPCACPLTNLLQGCWPILKLKPVSRGTHRLTLHSFSVLGRQWIFKGPNRRYSAHKLSSKNNFSLRLFSIPLDRCSYIMLPFNVVLILYRTDPQTSCTLESPVELLRNTKIQGNGRNWEIGTDTYMLLILHVK